MHVQPRWTHLIVNIATKYFLSNSKRLLLTFVPFKWEARNTLAPAASIFFTSSDSTFRFVTVKWCARAMTRARVAICVYHYQSRKMTSTHAPAFIRACLSFKSVVLKKNFIHVDPQVHLMINYIFILAPVQQEARTVLPPFASTSLFPNAIWSRSSLTRLMQEPERDLIAIFLWQI